MDKARIAWRLKRNANAIALIGMTDPDRLPDPVAALQALPPGSALIWRAYGVEPNAADLRRLSSAAERKNCRLLLAGHPRFVRRLNAGGLHLPERMAGRRFNAGYVVSLNDLPPGVAVTVACHSERAIHAAAKVNADAVVISPVFPTASHPHAKSLGVSRFARLARLAQSLGMAPYALGGIATEANIRRLSGTGAAGVAGISFLAP